MHVTTGIRKGEIRPAESKMPEMVRVAIFDRVVEHLLGCD